jgi:hypothetical protein
MRSSRRIVSCVLGPEFQQDAALPAEDRARIIDKKSIFDYMLMAVEIGSRTEYCVTTPPEAGGLPDVDSLDKKHASI